MKALDDWKIKDIRKQYSDGKTLLQLANQYNVHYRTIENYINGYSKPAEKAEKIDIKVIGTTPGKTLNFMNVTEIKREGGWIQILNGTEVIGLLEPQNITAIIQCKGESA